VGIVKVRFAASLLFTNIAVYFAGNSARQCDFCAREQGWPLTYYVGPALVGDAHYVWLGVLTDLSVSVSSAMLLTLIWCFLAQTLKAPADRPS
jgi:hypothetical protein